MIAIRTAGVIVAAGLVVGCQAKREQPRAASADGPPVQAAESLRQSLVRANPDARVGIVAATVGRFAAVRDVPAGNVAENATVQILDPAGEVVGYGLVRAVKDNTIHVLYLEDARRGPAVGDLVMPAADAGVTAEEMPASETMQPAAESAEPSLLPPRRGAAEAPAEAAPAEAPPADAQPMPAGNEVPPRQPAPSLNEEAQPGDFQPTQPDNKATLPPVEGGAEAAQPAPAAEQPVPAAEQPAPAAEQPAPAAEQPAPEPAAEPAAEPAVEPAPKPAEPSPGDTNNSAGDAGPAPKEPAGEPEKDPAPVDDKKAPAPEAPGLNK